NHLVIDEGQEFASDWYGRLGKSLITRQAGLTVFHDLNQIGNNYQSGDTKRYEQRLETWGAAMRAIPGTTASTLHINYRNSREIADYYSGVLRDTLPSPLRSEVPAFGAGDVIKRRTNVNEVPRLSPSAPK